MRNYTKEYFLELVENVDNLNFAIKNTNGLILFEMEKLNVLPKLSSLFDLRHGVTVPFILQFYALDEADLSEIRSWVSVNNRNIEASSTDIPVFVDERLKRDITPKLAAELISEHIDFDVKEDMSIDFLLETFDCLNDLHNIFNRYYVDFSIKCLLNAVTKGECIYKNKHLNRINSIIEGSSSCPPELLLVREDKEYSIEVVRSWGISATKFSFIPFIEMPIKHMKNLGFDNEHVLNTFREVFQRLYSKNKLDKETIDFFTSIGYLDSSHQGSSLNNLTQLKEIFANKIPFFWNLEDLNNPDVQKTITEYLLNPDLTINYNFHFAFQDSVFDLIFTEKRIEELATQYRIYQSLNIFLDNNEEDYMPASKILATALIFKKMIAMGKNPYGDDYYVFPIDVLIKNIVAMNYKDNALSAKYIDRFYQVVLDTPEFFNYEVAPNLFDNSVLFPSVREVMKGRTPLDAFFREYLNSMTFDKFLHIETRLTQEEKVEILNNNFNPYDIALLKEISVLNNFDGVVGNPQIKRATSENCMLYRASTFSSSSLNILKITALSKAEDLPCLRNLFLESDEMLLNGDLFFKELKSKKDLVWIDFAVKYQKKFPGFLTDKNETRVAINNIYGLSARMGIINTTDYSYKAIRKVLSTSPKSDIKVFWDNMPLEVKETFIEASFKSQDFVPALLMNDVTFDLFAEKLFAFSLKEFDKVIPNDKKTISSLVSVYVDRDLGEEHLDYLFALCRKNKYLGFTALRRIKDNKKNNEFAKNLIIKNYPEFIFEFNRFDVWDVTSLQVKEAMENIMNLDEESLCNIFVSFNFETMQKFSNNDVVSICNKIKELPLSKRILVVNLFNNILSLDIAPSFQNKLEEFLGVKGVIFSSLLQLVPEVLDSNVVEKDKDLFCLLKSIVLDINFPFKLNSFFKCISLSSSGGFENKIYEGLSQQTINLYAKSLLADGDDYGLLKLKLKYNFEPLKNYIKLDENVIDKFILFATNDLNYQVKDFQILGEMADVLTSAVLNPLTPNSLIDEISYHVNTAMFAKKYLIEGDFNRSLKIMLLNDNLLSALDIYKKANTVKNIFSAFDVIENLDSSVNDSSAFKL